MPAPVISGPRATTLELAPSYPQALELLLELRAATTISQWIQD
jgi:hypothetical protein